MRVLIVEDEPFLAEALQAGLRHEAIAADIALDGDAAPERIAVNDYDVIVLDRDIPGIHGGEVCAIAARAPDGAGADAHCGDPAGRLVWGVSNARGRVRLESCRAQASRPPEWAACCS